MWFPSSLRNRSQPDPGERISTARSRRRRTDFLPRLDPLERRVVLSTLTVTNNLGYGPGSLQAEIAAAQSGDTIVFAKGIGSRIFVGIASDASPTEFEINKNLNIEGPGATKLAISGGGGSRVFEVDAGVQVTLSGLTIEHGIGTWGGFDPDRYDGMGGGILNLGTLVVSNCIVTGNDDMGSGLFQLNVGGGIYNAGTLSLSNTQVTNNTANYGGGIYNAGTLSLSGTTASKNTAYYGGGIYNDTTGTLMVLNSSVTHNTAYVAGADLFNLGTWTADSHSKIGTVGP